MVEARRSSGENPAAEYALLTQIADELRRRIELLNAALGEMAAAKSALEEVEKLETGEEILVPLGSGVYLKATIADKQSALLALGADVVVERSFSEIREYLDRREQQIREALQKSVNDYQVVVSRLRELERELRATAGSQPRLTL